MNELVTKVHTIKVKTVLTNVFQTVFDGSVVYKGTWDVSTGLLPGSGSKGWLYKASTDGTVNGFDIPKGAWIFFLTDNPGQTLSNYDIR